MTDEQKRMAKGLLRSYANSALKRKGKQYLCPLCDTGTKNKGTSGFSITKDGLHWTCFACGSDGDIFDLIEAVEGLEKGQGMNRAKELFYIRDEAGVESVKATVAGKEKVEAQATEDFNHLFLEAKANIGLSDYYGQRGFSPETIERFNLGYVMNGQYLNALIPVSKGFYILRSVQGNFKMNKVGNGYKVSIMNKEALYNDRKEPVFICEAWADALSIAECGREALSINSVNNTDLLIKAVTERKPTGALVIAFDDDEAGNKAAEDLRAALLSLNLPSTRFIPTGYKDLNEMLVADRPAFEKAVDAAVAEAVPMPAYNAGYVVNALFDVVESYTNGTQGALPTRYRALDEAIGGGLFPGLCVVGAESSQGKSCLAMNIAENVAEAGGDVLWFALEMTLKGLVARGLSKQSFILSGQKSGYSSGEIKQGQACNLAAAVEAYKGKIAQRLVIVENHTGLTVDDLCQRVEEHIQGTGRKPLVIVDYLQLLRDDVHQTEKQKTDASVVRLKGLCTKHGLHMIVISSLNRNSYGELVKMDSFKESGAIEYTADLILGLSLAACQRNKDGKGQTKPLSHEQVDTAMKEQPRKMLLQVLKGRDIENRAMVKFDYYSKYNLFCEEKVQPNLFK